MVGSVPKLYPKPLVESILTPSENENLGEGAEDYRSNVLSENEASAAHWRVQ